MIKKVFTQYIDLFKIIQRIERLTYRLDISFDWKIHSIFSIAQFESTSDLAKDSYDRSRSTHSSSVTDTQNEYEIERLLNKKIVRRKHEYFTEYLIRWKEYESEFDKWYNVKNLENAKKLVSDYEKKLERFKNTTWSQMNRLFNILIRYFHLILLSFSLDLKLEDTRVFHLTLNEYTNYEEHQLIRTTSVNTNFT
jgi:hypothetical protein